MFNEGMEGSHWTHWDKLKCSDWWGSLISEIEVVLMLIYKLFFELIQVVLIQRCPHFSPLCTEVSPFQGVGIEGQQGGW